MPNTLVCASVVRLRELYAKKKIYFAPIYKASVKTPFVFMGIKLINVH